MRIAQIITAADAYDAHRRGGHSARQRELIMRFIKLSGGDWSIGEIAHALELQKSTVSARLNELINADELVAKAPRKDRRSGITVRPVGLPVAGQQELFSMTAQPCPADVRPAGTPSPYHGELEGE